MRRKGRLINLCKIFLDMCAINGMREQEAIDEMCNKIYEKYKEIKEYV